MLYGKLLVTLLSTIATEKSQSTNQHIAQYVLEHRHELAGISIQQLANACNVGTGTVSRFCREIGLDDFSEMKQLINELPAVTPYSTGISYEQRVVRCSSRAVKTIVKAEETLILPDSHRQIEKLCRDIHRYPCVFALGMLRSACVALSLQQDLIACGKLIFVPQSFRQQADTLEQSTADDLIIVFSNEGVYFEYQFSGNYPSYLKAPRIYMITTGVPINLWYFLPIHSHYNPCDRCVIVLEQ